MIDAYALEFLTFWSYSHDKANTTAFDHNLPGLWI